jgi:hypothetical protein
MSTLPRRRYDKPTQYIFFSAYLKRFRLKFTIVIGIKCVEEVGDNHGQKGSNVSFISSKKMWTFGSGLLLCQSFRRRREETAWK